MEFGTIERSELLNVVEQEDNVTTTATTRLESQREVTTVDSAVESNTIEPSTYTARPTAEADVTTASSDELDYTSDRPDDVVATTTAPIESYEFNPDLVTIVSTERAADNVSEVPRRRKVILRRRPVSSTAANDVETEEEEEEKSPQVARRRKIIRRIRPVADTSSPTSAEVILEEEVRGISFPESTSPMNSRKSIAEESTIATGQPTVTGDMEDSTLAGITETTLSMADNIDGFTKVTLETPVPESTTTTDEGITDFLSTIAGSTIDSGVDEEYRSTGEIGTEATTAESTATADLTESDAFLEETLLSSTESEDFISGRARTTSTLSTSDSSPATRPNSEPKYTRKKFIRKSPVSGNTTNRYPPSSSTENSSQEVLSKRRNNLFVRRYPVSSTSSNTELKYEGAENGSREPGVEQEEATEEEEDTTLRSHRVSNEPTSAVLRDDSAEFWRHYTPASSTASRTYLSDRLEDEDRATSTTLFADQDSPYRSTLSTGRRLEARPRYKVPVILKRPFDPEEALSPRRFHPLDSAPEESEDTPETKDARLKQSGFRQPRTRYRLLERGNVKVEEATVVDVTPPELTTWQHFRTRSYAKRPSVTTTSTEAAVTETLIPAKKFDYAADAVHRKQQSLRTTTAKPRSGDSFYDSNLVDYASTTTAKPLVTRLVTSVAESGTTERQKILIKTKYSSLTSTTRIPADHFLSTTPSSFSVTGGSGGDDDDESVNEIRPGIERSTLPIEGEFNYRYGRFTTESHESSTIEIESVFSNLIADKGSAN